ncbi:CLUMA_CG005430, isoform A [Clunio marinus]|uniref:CLUMA_CG005430, isoform A n=1 Tax=Clunio marinus TaxID=568069 RepID=A0A1J1HUX7_9DIPT|nr:CLUMA_CG005430, isoform A [Clunio marinus]
MKFCELNKIVNRQTEVKIKEKVEDAKESQIIGVLINDVLNKRLESLKEFSQQNKSKAEISIKI